MKLEAFFKYLESLFDFSTVNNYSLFLSADFNISMLDRSPAREGFNNMLESFGFINVVKCPTSITLTSESILDLFMTNTEKQLVALISDISDHLLIFSFIENNKMGNILSAATFQSITEKSLCKFRE